MTIQTPALGNDFFTYLPIEMTAEVVPHLRGTGDENDSEGIEKDKAIIRTSQVCTQWKTFLLEERVQATNRLKDIFDVRSEYPYFLLRLFKECHLSIATLPKLDLGENTGMFTSGIPPSDMRYSVMRFKDVEYGNSPGMAFHLRARNAQNGQFLEYIWILKRLYRSDNKDLHNKWINIHSRASNAILNSLYSSYHDQYEHIGPIGQDCPTCHMWSIDSDSDITDRSLAIICRLLLDQDRVCILPEHIPRSIDEAKEVVGRTVLALRAAAPPQQNHSSMKRYIITACAVAALSFVITYTFKGYA